MNITNEGLVLMGSAIGAGLAVIAGIGPRPALWNQDDLISERDEYGINDLKPGLTGWAQINGRDELPIPEKVQMDKIYRDNVSFVFDVKCLFMTVVSVFKHDGVVEGGTGAIADEE